MPSEFYMVSSLDSLKSKSVRSFNFNGLILKLQKINSIWHYKYTVKQKSVHVLLKQSNLYYVKSGCCFPTRNCQFLNAQFDSISTIRISRYSPYSTIRWKRIILVRFVVKNPYTFKYNFIKSLLIISQHLRYVSYRPSFSAIYNIILINADFFRNVIR